MCVGWKTHTSFGPDGKQFFVALYSKIHTFSFLVTKMEVACLLSDFFFFFVCLSGFLFVSLSSTQRVYEGEEKIIYAGTLHGCTNACIVISEEAV